MANELTEKANDYEQLEPMVEAIETNTSQRAGILLADNGYLSESNLKALERRGQQALIAVRGRKSSPLAQGSPGAADAPDLTTALGPATLRAAEDPGGAAVCRDQGTTFRRFMLRGQEKVMGEWDLVLGLQRDGALSARTRFAHVRPWI